MSPTEQLRQEIVAALERYEQSARRYCAKVEVDRPWVAEAHWLVVWEFRKSICMLLAQLKKDLAQAQHTQDPG